MLHRLLIALILCAPTTAALAQDAAATPGKIIETRSKAVVTTLVERRDEFRADRAALDRYVRSELETIFDREYSARLVLARHARKATDAQILAFADALTNNLMQRYGEALLDVTGNLDVRIRAETPLRDGRMMRVNSEIIRPGQPSVPIDYLFLASGDGWKAFDVIVEGVSYVQTYRGQFDSLLRTESLDAVTQRLAEGSLRVSE